MSANVPSVEVDGPRRLDGDANRVVEGCPCARHQAQSMRLTMHPGYGMVRVQPRDAQASCCGPPRTARTHRRHNLRNRDRIRARVQHRDDDALGIERDAVEGQLLNRREVPAADEPVGAPTQDPGEEAGEQQNREQGEQPRLCTVQAQCPGRHVRHRRLRCHTRPPCPEEAHPAELGELALVGVEHEVPGYRKVVSRIARSPWHSITVSVRSDGCRPVPVRKTSKNIPWR